MYRKKEENFKNIWRAISYTSHKYQKKSFCVCQWTEKRKEIKKTRGAPFSLFKLLKGEYYRASFY